jgi:restriction system protein
MATYYAHSCYFARMSELSFPTSAVLMLAVVDAIKKAGGKASNRQIQEIVIKDLKLSSEQVAVIHSGNRSELEYRLAWARTNAKKKGLINSSGPRTWVIP